MLDRPNLFIVGAQKCGTTFLAKHLARRSEIVFSQPKETFFFQRQGPKGALDEYLETYFQHRASPDKQDARFMVDGTTTNMWRRETMRDIINMCGEDIRVIFAVREPLSRTLAHVMHDVRRHPEVVGPVADLPTSVYAERSMYARAAAMWIKRLGYERVLPMKFDDLQRSPLDFINQVPRFLGIRPFQKVPPKEVNAGIKLVRQGDVVRPREGAGPEFPIALLQQLHAGFADDTQRTQRLTGLDLTEWAHPSILRERS